MQIRPLPNKLYVLFEGLLFLALLVFQCISIANGYRIYNQEGPYYPFIGAFQISLTALTFLFALRIFFIKKDKGRTRLDLFPCYFLFILIADVFFSFTAIPLGGHIGFLCAYILFFFIRKGHWVEAIIALCGGSAALIVIALIGKLTPTLGVDCYLGAMLICNMASLWIRFGRQKKKELLPVCIALTLIVLSDGSIALRTFVTSFPANHIIALITWPTYIVANILLALHYAHSKEAPKEAR